MDNRPATVATAAWGSPTYSDGDLQAALTFSGANITGLSASDFQVLTSTNAATSGWTVQTPPATLNAGVQTTILATPPANTNGTFKIQVNASSVMSGGSSINNSPANPVRTTAVAVDNRVSRGNFILEGTIGGFLSSSRNYARYPRAVTNPTGSRNEQFTTDGRHFYKYNPTSRRAYSRGSATSTGRAMMGNSGDL